jgi:glycosyltransferase involved in cell wall biosynthesis
MRICVVTSYSATAEPRAPRHAIAAKYAFPDAEVIFVDMVAASNSGGPDPASLSANGIKRLSIRFPTRASSPVHLAIRKVKTLVGRASFTLFDHLQESVFGARAQGLTRALKGVPADVYIAHNIETLLPAVNAAKVHGGTVVFDCMEYYADMGDGQNKVEARAAQKLQHKYLRTCALVIASSDNMADVLASEYSISRPLAAYNVPPKIGDLPNRRADGLKLYWRNSVIGFGQRGLEDAIEAMTLLPADVKLFLQGRLPADVGTSLTKRIERLGLAGRVVLLPPYSPESAVHQAALYDVGLCMERQGPRNHDLTVSNKIFDYHMAGLAVIATDLAGLADVVRRSGAGLICQPKNPASLAKAVLRLRSDPERLKGFQINARRFAMEEANLEFELEKIKCAMQSAIPPQRTHF